MTATAHALVAGAIAAKFPEPITAATLALVSHFIMDAIPHWDIGTNWRNRTKSATGILAIAETTIGITIAYVIYIGKVPPLPLTFAIIASLLPDWLETPWYIFFANNDKKEPNKDASFWEILAYRTYKIENMFHTKAKFPLGVFTQIATVFFFLFLLS